MKPQFTLTTETENQSFAKFVFEPLPQGFGHTLGNSLRRVLYSSIEGAAITEVKVNGTTHQFTSLEGVQEDIVQLILNLKEVRFTMDAAGPVHVTLSVKGPGEVTAADFELPGGVKVVNPEFVLAHLTDKSTKLELEATLETGYGYSPAEDRPRSSVGTIPMDATFSPVLRVNFSVEATRVGRVTNFDKLVLEVTTDGSVSPRQALESASQTLVEYFQAVLSPAVAPSASSSAPAVSSAPVKTGVGSNVSVEELDLPTRIANALQKAGLETVADILATPRAELAKVKNLGIKSVKIVELALRERGFELP